MQAPATIAERIAASTLPSESASTANVTPEIAHTPAASPSSPSRKLTMFITATIQTIVSGTPIQAGRSTAPRNGKREVVDPDAERRRDRRREHLARRASAPVEAAEVVDRADDAAPRRRRAGCRASRRERSRNASDGTRMPRKIASPPSRGIGRRLSAALVRAVDDAEQARHAADGRRQQDDDRRTRSRAPVEDLRVVAQLVEHAPSTSCRTAGRLRRRGPGRCSPSRSARGRSTATTIETSGWSRWMRSIPSGAAISAISRTDVGARALDRLDRGRRRVAGREHRVEQDHVALGDVVRQLHVVLDGLRASPRCGTGR